MDEFPSDPQICRQCGGLCCQGHPGVYADPEGFVRRYFGGERVTPERLHLNLPLLGMELRDVRGVPIPAPRFAPWGCIHLGATGCRLPVEDRPQQCKALIPEIETLMEGEMHCRLPEEFGTGSIREVWRRFWVEQR